MINQQYSDKLIKYVAKNKEQSGGAPKRRPTEQSQNFDNRQPIEQSQNFDNRRPIEQSQNFATRQPTEQFPSLSDSQSTMNVNNDDRLNNFIRQRIEKVKRDLKLHQYFPQNTNKNIYFTMLLMVFFSNKCIHNYPHLYLLLCSIDEYLNQGLITSYACTIFEAYHGVACNDVNMVSSHCSALKKEQILYCLKNGIIIQIFRIYRYLINLHKMIFY
jgi:hypothetical protein